MSSCVVCVCVCVSTYWCVLLVHVCVSVCVCLFDTFFHYHYFAEGKEYVFGQEWGGECRRKMLRCACVCPLARARVCVCLCVRRLLIPELSVPVWAVLRVLPPRSPSSGLVQSRPSCRSLSKAQLDIFYVGDVGFLWRALIIYLFPFSCVIVPISYSKLLCAALKFMLPYCTAVCL